MKTATAAVLLVIAASLQTAAPAPAKDKPAYERGVLLQMDSTHCGYAEKDGKTLAASCACPNRTARSVSTSSSL